MITKTIVLIVASNGYQPIEYGDTRKALEQKGIRVVVASDKGGFAISRECPFAPEDYVKAKVDILVTGIDLAKYDGIFLSVALAH